MQNKPNFKTSKFAVTPYFLMPTAYWQMPDVDKNEPKRTQSLQSLNIFRKIENVIENRMIKD